MTNDDGYKVIPVLIDSTPPEAIKTWVGIDLMAITIDEQSVGSKTRAVSGLLAAIQGLPPDDQPDAADVTAAPVAELVLELREPTIQVDESKRRPQTDAAVEDSVDPITAATQQLTELQSHSDLPDSLGTVLRL